MAQLFNPRREGGVSLNMRMVGIGSAQLEKLPAFALERLCHPAIVPPPLAMAEKLFHGRTHRHHKADDERDRL